MKKSIFDQSGQYFFRDLSEHNADGFDLFSKKRRIGAVLLKDCRS